MIVPCLQGPAIAVLPQFLRSQELLLRLLGSAEGVDMERARYTSPIARMLRMNLMAAFCTTAAHQRRHLWAAWQTKRQLK